MKNSLRKSIAILAIFVLAAVPALAVHVEGTGLLWARGHGWLEVEGEGSVTISGTGLVRVEGADRTKVSPGWGNTWQERVGETTYTYYEGSGRLILSGDELEVRFDGTGRVKAEGTGFADFDGDGSWYTKKSGFRKPKYE
ncbi:hypothetical protein CMO92_00280 [Candidatus Woesearchaeota archaeon]|nr:hypothetical protein [Candidatus Woesearchaeota archaeon]|tara:strand:- start:1298 stop:1717 length:420 start_codon:yes stop_codon:yes gene_type:complete